MTKTNSIRPVAEATRDQIIRANAAVEANLNEDGSPKYDSAQGYACALTAIMQSDAARPAVDVGELGKAVGYALHICPTIEPDAYARDLTAAEHEYIAKTVLERLTTMGDNSRG
jgi:hypothetical protein